MKKLEKRIKICGLTRPEDVEAVNLWKPDYAGFVFAPGKRQISSSAARLLRDFMLPEIPSVGVFVNSPMEEIISLVKDHTIGLIQLHGDENKDYIKSLKKKLGCPVPIIKAVRVRSKEDINEASHLPADFLLFDTYSRDSYGGSGRAFDWTMIPEIKKPWFLAGGLGAANIKEAMETNAFCLDLSSSVETEGFKDPEKIKEIIQIVRSENLCQKEDLDSTADNLSPKR
jgi:phosphoribosylanthranilate isomerase